MRAHESQIRSIEELTLSREEKTITLWFTRVTGGKPYRDGIEMKFKDHAWVFSALHHLAPVDSLTGRQLSDLLKNNEPRFEKSPEQLFDALRNLKLVATQLGPSCEDDETKREALHHDPYFEYKYLSRKIKRPYLPVRADARWALVGMSTLEKPPQERDYELVVYKLGDPKPVVTRVIDETGKVQPSGRTVQSSQDKASTAPSSPAVLAGAHEKKKENADIPASTPEATSQQPPRNDQQSPTHSKRSRLSMLLLASAGVAVLLVVGAIAMKSRLLAPGVADVRVTLKIEFESVHVVRLAIGAAQLASRKPALGDAGIFYFACRMDANRDFHVTSAELSVARRVSGTKQGWN